MKYVSKRYGKMLNASARIQRSHSRQIKRIRKIEDETKTKLEGRIHILDAKEAYQYFLQNMAEAINNIKHWVENIFAQTDAVENNNIGPLARDRRFLSSINKLMGNQYRNKETAFICSNCQQLLMWRYVNHKLELCTNFLC